jgi:diguanylate cyclase (GGDEF)-like protein
MSTNSQGVLALDYACLPSTTPEICRSILESLPAGLCVVDMQKKVVFWSDGAERITGQPAPRSPRPLLCLRDVCCTAIRQAANSAERTARSPDCHQDLALHAETSGYLHHKAGYEIPVRIRAVPVHNQHGSIIGAVETFEELQPTASLNRRDSLNLPGCMDEVTCLASPALMQSHVRRTLATFVEVQVPFAVLCLRLEGLLHFRASLGPEAASSLLRIVARSLESTLWTTDYIGRWSDDQFLVILNGCREEALPSVRERVRRMLAGDGIEWWGERRSLPFSIGHAAAQPDDTVESMMERVQKSLETAAAWRTNAASASSGTGGS